ncbi:hypothetical protein DIRU0_D01948 [Diutina rugosa]
MSSTSNKPVDLLRTPGRPPSFFIEVYPQFAQSFDPEEAYNSYRRISSVQQATTIFSLAAAMRESRQNSMERYKNLDVDSMSAALSRNLERRRIDLQILAKHATPDEDDQLDLASLISSLERMLATPPQEQQECKSWIESASKLLRSETAIDRMHSLQIRLANFKALCGCRMQFSNDITSLDTFEFDRKEFLRCYHLVFGDKLCDLLTEKKLNSFLIEPPTNYHVFSGVLNKKQFHRFRVEEDIYDVWKGENPEIRIRQVTEEWKKSDAVAKIYLFESRTLTA